MVRVFSVAALLALAGCSTDSIVLSSGERVSCTTLVREPAAPGTRYDDFIVRCDNARHRLGDLRAVVDQR